MKELLELANIQTEITAEKILLLIQFLTDKAASEEVTFELEQNTEEFYQAHCYDKRAYGDTISDAVLNLIFTMWKRGKLSEEEKGCIRVILEMTEYYRVDYEQNDF